MWQLMRIAQPCPMFVLKLCVPYQVLLHRRCADLTMRVILGRDIRVSLSLTCWEMLESKFILR